MAPSRPSRSVTGLGSMLLVVLVALGTWFVSGGEPGSRVATDDSVVVIGPETDSSAEEAQTSPGPEDDFDPFSGLYWIERGDLPPEAITTLALIADGGPFPEDEDGSRFGNYERLLPDEPDGYYAEYTVPTPGSPDRGARRIVAGDGGELYYTADHYASFRRIRG